MSIQVRSGDRWRLYQEIHDAMTERGPVRLHLQDVTFDAGIAENGHGYVDVKIPHVLGIELGLLQRAIAPDERMVLGDEVMLEEALKAARERGRVRAAAILAGPDMLTARAFAKLLGVSAGTVRARRQKHEVLGIKGDKGHYRYPSWQVGRNGKPLSTLPQLREMLGGPWTVYRFLLQHHPELGGMTALTALRRGREADVLATAANIARGAFS